MKSGEYSDLTILCEDQTFSVHKVVVCSQSKVLAAAMKKGFKVLQNPVAMAWHPLHHQDQADICSSFSGIRVEHYQPEWGWYLVCIPPNLLRMYTSCPSWPLPPTGLQDILCEPWVLSDAFGVATLNQSRSKDAILTARSLSCTQATMRPMQICCTSPTLLPAKFANTSYGRCWTLPGPASAAETHHHQAQRRRLRTLQTTACMSRCTRFQTCTIFQPSACLQKPSSRWLARSTGIPVPSSKLSHAFTNPHSNQIRAFAQSYLTVFASIQMISWRTSSSKQASKACWRQHQNSARRC